MRQVKRFEKGLVGKTVRVFFRGGRFIQGVVSRIRVKTAGGLKWLYGVVVSGAFVPQRSDFEEIWLVG